LGGGGLLGGGEGVVLEGLFLLGLEDLAEVAAFELGVEEDLVLLDLL